MPSGAESPDAEVDVSDFEDFAPETPDEPKVVDGRVEVAGKTYSKKSINEARKKNNKYIYGRHVNNFRHLVNEGQFDGLIDFNKADENRSKLVTEMKKADWSTKSFDIEEKLDTINENQESQEDGGKH